MSPEMILYLVLGGLAGGFINGFAGTGTALFAMGVLLIVLDPKTAVATIALVAVLAGVQGVWEVRKAVRANLSRIMRFLVPGMIGVPIGLALLGTVDARNLRILVATLLIVYGGYFGFRRNLPKLERPTPVVDMTIGGLGGILGGLAAISGALPSIWLSMRPWPKAETRAVLQPFNIAILTWTVLLLALNGGYGRATWQALAVVLPVGLIAAQVGLMTFRRVSDDMFRRMLIILCLVMGLAILLREII